MFPPPNNHPPANYPPQYHPPANYPPQYDPPTNYPPQYDPPANYPPQYDPPQYDTDMEEFLRFEAEEAAARRAREEYLRGKQARRNARRAYRMAHGLPYVATSDDDSSDSSQEGFVSDDSFY